MKQIGILFCLIPFLAAVSAGPVAAQAVPVVDLPRQGGVLQGVVTVRGSSDLPGFVSSEVAFTYAGDTTGTWFMIATSSQPVDLDTLATWDTTAITDGNYNLRLRVYLSDGSFLDAVVSNLRVRNYSPIETPTPAPTALQATPNPTATPTSLPFPTPTALPNNPVVVTPTDISKSIAYGGVGAIIFLIGLGIYIRLRR